MHIREVKIDDDKELRAFYEVLRDAELHDRVGMPMWSEHECAVMFRHPEPTEIITAYGAFESDELVGAAFTALTLLDNSDKAFVHVAVAPRHRHRGLGTRLADHVAQIAATAGRTTLLADANIPTDQREDHPHRRFAERQGFALANIEVHRMLPLPIAAASLDGWEATTAPHHEDYHIETFVDELPLELLDSYCYLLNQLVVDAPTGDIEFEPEAITPETFRTLQDKLRAQGRTMYRTVALNSVGEAVAHTVLVVPSHDPLNVYQWATLVRRDHRGHRLRLAMKARNLRAVQAEHTDRTRVFTCNAEDNGPMVDINILMGFQPIELLAEFQRKLLAEDR